MKTTFPLLAAVVASTIAAGAQPSGGRLLVLNKEDATFVIVDPDSGAVLGKVAAFSCSKLHRATPYVRA